MTKMIMKKEEIIEAIKNIKNGTMARICYMSELPMKAAYSKKGYKIYRTTETTARFGCDYNNLKSVIEKKSDPNYTPSTKKTTYTWLVENKISHNENTGKDYVRFVPMNKNSNKRTTYTFEDSLGEKFILGSEVPDYFKKLVQDSYWTKKSAPEIQTICLENVIYIRSKSAK